MASAPDDLPIEPAIPELRDALRSAGVAVLQAPPGAGKTTRVPLALLDEPWLAGRRIVMLEPRRLAARAAANRMAETLGEQPGATVGFRIRHETRVGPRTRVEVVTEGVLTRMLRADPARERSAESRRCSRARRRRSFRFTAPFPGSCRTGPSAPAHRAAARSCSPPPSPKRVSRSRAFAWWSTAACPGCHGTRRGAA